MSDERDFDFELMPTGVPNLDVILGGGVPVGSFNLIAGGPGVGKTILAQEMMFHNATPERPALHFTVLGEPVAKLLRYQSRFSFFDASKINSAIRFIDIGDVVRKEGLERGLEVILDRVERHSPSIVVVDSVRAVRELARREGEYGLRTFTHDLAQVAVVWETTSFLVGEYEEQELRVGPEFTMADGILWMEMAQADNSLVRKLQAVKMRGMAIVEGKHSYRIDRDGIHVYPRLAPVGRGIPLPSPGRASFGVPGLDAMMNGGIPYGETCLIAGASGTGKSALAQRFVAEGAERGESAVVLTFEETPEEYARRAEGFGWPFGKWVDEGKLALVYRRPMDLTPDEVIEEARTTVARVGAKRLVIDSISGFELARAPADRSNFREALYRMIGWFRAEGVTVLMTNEVPELFAELRFSNYDISFIADNIILLRYLEIESALRRAVVVAKMRTSDHAKELRRFEITDRGMVIGAPFKEFTGLLSGVPTMVAVMGPQPFAPGLDPGESVLVEALFGLGVASAEQLAGATGQPVAEVQRTLDSLIGGGYVVRGRRDGVETYHVAMVSWAPGVRRADMPRTRKTEGQGRGD